MAYSLASVLNIPLKLFYQESLSTSFSPNSDVLLIWYHTHSLLKTFVSCSMNPAYCSLLYSSVFKLCLHFLPSVSDLPFLHCQHPSPGLTDATSKSEKLAIHPHTPWKGVTLPLQFLHQYRLAVFKAWLSFGGWNSGLLRPPPATLQQLVMPRTIWLI